MTAVEGACHEACRRPGTLPVFLAKLAQPQPGRSYAVKRALELTGGNPGQEHMWLDAARLEPNGDLSGLLANESREPTRTTLGERYSVSQDALSDWMITDADGRMWGAFTVRALLPQLDPAQRAEFERLLHPEPDVAAAP